MSVSRYYFTRPIGSQFLSTTTMNSRIFNAVDSGRVASKIGQISDGQRLDQLAFSEYGDASLWWIIAAASGISWPMQLQAGTYVRVPTNLDIIFEIIGDG